MKKQLTYKQLKAIIKECACDALKDAGMGMEPVESVELVKLSSEPEIKAGLFPGMSTIHGDEDEQLGGVSSFGDDAGGDQGEKGMILANLAKMKDKAAELHSLAGASPNSEEWVQEKIAVASAMIDSIHNYLKYKQD
jgi:hypothetical protein